MMLRAGNLDALPGVRHGFFTRRGGVSGGPFASLNCGFSGSDAGQRVRENRARALTQLGLAPASLCTARQVHGATVRAVREPNPDPPVHAADGLVTDRPGVTIAVLHADCAPVLLADRQAQIVGCAHAGWRGALAGVIEATVAAMVDLGAEPKRISAAIGPCIAKPSYEVGQDMAAQFTEEDCGSEAWFEPIDGSDRLRFDLKAYALHRLQRAGVGDCLALPDDTFADPARFFSARRARRQGDGRFGLLLSAIALAG